MTTEYCHRNNRWTKPCFDPFPNEKRQRHSEQQAKWNERSIERCHGFLSASHIWIETARRGYEKKVSSRPKLVRSHVRAREPARTRKEETKKEHIQRKKKTYRFKPNPNPKRSTNNNSSYGSIYLGLPASSTTTDKRHTHTYIHDTLHLHAHNIARSLTHSLSSSHAHKQHTLLHYYMTIFRVRMLVEKYIDSARAE